MYTIPNLGGGVLIRNKNPFFNLSSHPERNMRWEGAWHESNTPRRWDSHGVLREGGRATKSCGRNMVCGDRKGLYPTAASVQHSPLSHSHHLGRRLLVMMPAPSEAEIATCQSLVPSDLAV